MTVNRGPGVAINAGVGVTTLEHRLQLAGLYAENAPGVPRTGVLANGATVLVFARADMSWDVVPFQSVINRTASEGVYTPTVTGTVNVPTTAAPVTDSRWDLLYIKQNDVAKGDADNLAVLGVVQGVVAASPSKPTGSLPSGAMVLSESRIFAGTTGTNVGSNTTAQVWRHTAARGAPIPVRNATERGEITPGDGTTVRRLDLAGRPLQAWDGSNWLSGSPERIAVTTGDGTWAYNVTLTRTLNDNGSWTVSMGLLVARTSGGAFSVPTGSWTVIFAGLIPSGWRPNDNIITCGGYEFNGMGAVLIRVKTDGNIEAQGVTGSVSMGSPVKVCASAVWSY